MSYFILLSLGLAASGVSYWLRNDNYWLVNALGANLAAGFFGSLATLFFIERSIERKRQQERTRLAGLALRQICISLTRIVILFSEMIKAAAPKPFQSIPASLEDLFDSSNSALLDWIDLTAPTGRIDQRDWKAHADAVLSSEIDALLAVLDRYLPALEVTLIEAIESIANDGFAHYLRTLRRASDNLSKAGLVGNITLYGTRQIRDRFFARLVTASKNLELAGGETVPVPTSLIREEMAPKAGDARLKALPAHPVLIGDGDPPTGGPPWNKSEHSGLVRTTVA